MEKYLVSGEETGFSSIDLGTAGGGGGIAGLVISVFDPAAVVLAGGASVGTISGAGVTVTEGRYPAVLGSLCMMVTEDTAGIGMGVKEEDVLIGLLGCSGDAGESVMG